MKFYQFSKKEELERGQDLNIYEIMQESYYKGYSPRNMEEDEDQQWRDASDPYSYPTLDHIGEAKENSTNPTQINN